MRYRLARITLAGALVTGVAPMLATSASANCSVQQVCNCADPDNPACLCFSVGGIGQCGFSEYLSPHR